MCGAQPLLSGRKEWSNNDTIDHRCQTDRLVDTRGTKSRPQVTEAGLMTNATAYRIHVVLGLTGQYRLRATESGRRSITPLIWYPWKVWHHHRVCFLSRLFSRQVPLSYTKWKQSDTKSSWLFQIVVLLMTNTAYLIQKWTKSGTKSLWLFSIHVVLMTSTLIWHKVNTVRIKSSWLLTTVVLLMTNTA